VAGDAGGELLREAAQLLAHGPVQLPAGDGLVDGRSVVPGLFGAARRLLAATGPVVPPGPLVTPVATGGRLPPAPIPAALLAAPASVAGTALRPTGATSGASGTAVSVATAPGVPRSASVSHNNFPSRGRARHAPTLIRPGHHGGPRHRAVAGVRE
jgi:hypothetical protein